jgi:hypothetical protein
LSPRRQRVLLFSGLALFAASGAACSAILGLDEPTLACPSGCPDANAPLPDVVIPLMDSTGSSSGGDSSPPPLDGGPPEAQSPDAARDASPGEDAPSGVRCGPIAAAIYCNSPTAFCCLTVSGADAASASYGCVTGANECAGYSIGCASDNDCSGTDICCFYASAIKCEPESTGDPGNSCASSVVCDPSLPAGDQCNPGQSCVPNLFKESGFTLPYDGCM